MTKTPPGFKFIKDPFEFQKDAIVFGLRKNYAGIFLEMGLGKTYVAINISRYRIQNNNIEKVLVICPASIMHNWLREIEKFSEYSCAILHDSNPQNRLYKLSQNKTFNIINYESLFPLLRDLKITTKIKKVNRKTKKAYNKIVVYENYKNKIKELGFDMLIFDESSRYLKSHTSDRMICSAMLADHAMYRLILTGTPTSNTMDIWPQFRVLDLGYSFGTNFYKFRNTFFKKVDRGRYVKYTIKKDRIPIISKLMNEAGIRITKREC